MCDRAKLASRVPGPQGEKFSTRFAPFSQPIGSDATISCAKRHAQFGPKFEVSDPGQVLRMQSPFRTRSTGLELTRTLVCWKDSRDARRTMAAVRQLSEGEPSRHGRPWVSMRPNQRGATIAKNPGAGPLVTFDHSRLREWLFGGVTRGLLPNAELH